MCQSGLGPVRKRESAEVKSQPGIKQLMLDPLSERELEILRLLPTGRSSPNLASYLGVSVNTVKTHMKNIYSKLAVHKRHEALPGPKSLALSS